MNVLLVSFNFCRADEAVEPYGVSCLVAAFENSLLQKNDKIFSHTIDLSKTKPCAENLADEISQKIRDEHFDILAFSNFVWADKLIRKIGEKIRKIFPNLKIIMGGAMVVAKKTEIEQGFSKNLQKNYPFVDKFIFSYGEKVFSDLHRYLVDKKQIISANISYDEYKTLVSPYLSGRILLKEGMSVRMETRRGCKFFCSYCRHHAQDDDKIYVVRNENL